MARTKRNRQLQNLRKAKKQKKRQENIKKHAVSKKMASRPHIEDEVDYALQYVEDGDWKTGAKILGKLKKKHGNHSYIHYGLGIIAAFNGNYKEAIQFFAKATQSQPDFIEAHYNLGVAYQKELQIPEMITTLQYVIKIGEPDSYVVHKAREILDGLEQHLQKHDGIDLNAYLKGYDFFNQGLQYMQSGDWEAAITAFNTLLGICNTHPQGYGNLGICYASTGKIKKALAAFDKAIELDPNYEPALLHRAMVETLREGECLKKKVKMMEYYKDYPRKNKSYIKEYAESQGLLEE